MAELTRSQKLRKYSVEHINRAYREGMLSARQKNDLLREKAHAEIDGMLDEKGYLRAVVEQSIVNLQKGWDNLKEAVVRKPTEGGVGEQIEGEAYYAGLAVWGQLQIVSAPFTAIGEVTGQVVERLALSAGASPGLARALNVATDIGTGFIPIGKVAQSTAKTVQHAGAAIAKKAGKAADTVKDTAKAAETISDDVAKAAKVLTEGLGADGVVDAHKVLAQAADAAGQPGGKQAFEAAADAVHAVDGSVRSQFMKDLAKFHDEMKKVTATQTHEETLAAAKKLGLTLDDLKNLVPGQALDEKQMAAYLKALDPQIDMLHDLAKKASEANASPEDLDRFVKHASEVFTTAPIFRGAEVTAGRSVEILKETPPMKSLTNMMLGWAPEQMAAGDFNGAAKLMAEDVATLLKNKEAGKAFVVQTQKSVSTFGEQTWPQLREIYINLLLARPLTQVRNLIGNSIAATNAVLERIAAGAFSLDKSAGVQWPEGAYMAKGMMASVGDGLKSWADAYKYVSPEEASKLDFIPHKIPGNLGRVINGPVDTLRGMDNFFKTILIRGHYYAEGLRAGMQKGLNGKALSDYVALRVQNPSVDMISAAKNFALEQTFQNDLGTLGQAALKLQTGPLALWFPFMKTPINLAKYAWNRTPGLQFLSQSLYRDILAGGPKADLAVARMTLASLHGMFFYNLAQEGLITGSGPVDPTLRKTWETTSQPYSVKTPEGWKRIANMEPGTTVVGMMADFAQVHNQLDEPTAGQIAAAGTFSIMKEMVDKTYWQTVGDLVDLTSALVHGKSAEKSLSKTLAAPLVTTLTLGPLVSSVTHIDDPVMREAHSLVDWAKSKVPGWSKELPPQRDGYGEPRLYPQQVNNKWLGMVLPTVTAPYETDRVKLEGSKLEAQLPSFPWSVGGNVKDDLDIREVQAGDRFGVALTPQQRDRWQQIYKNIIRHPERGIEAVLLDRPEYQEATPALKRQQFEGYFRDAKKTALDALTVEDGQLGRAIAQSDIAATRPLIPLNQRAEFDQTATRNLDLLGSVSAQERQNLLRWGILDPEQP